jgi:hypothetical protein
MKGYLTYKGKTRTIEIPTRWEEITFRVFIALQKCKGDWLKIFSVFTGISPEELISVRWKNLDDLLVATSFLNGDMPNTVPKTILGYAIPEDIGFETVGQYKYIKEDVEKSATMPPLEQLERYALYVAAYACTEKHGEFSWANTEAMADEFLDAPAPEVLATANFILLKLIGLSRPIGNGFQLRNTVRRRLRQVIRAWRLYLVSTVQLWQWRRKPISPPTS